MSKKIRAFIGYLKVLVNGEDVYKRQARYSRFFSPAGMAASSARRITSCPASAPMNLILWNCPTDGFSSSREMCIRDSSTAMNLVLNTMGLIVVLGANKFVEKLDVQGIF